MKASDARAMTVDQLDDEVLKLKKEQFNLRFQRATGQLESTSRVRVVRRDIAKLLTISSERRLGKTIAARPSAEKPAKEKKPKAEKAAAKPAAKLPIKTRFVERIAG